MFSIECISFVGNFLVVFQNFYTSKNQRTETHTLEKLMQIGSKTLIFSFRKLKDCVKTLASRLVKFLSEMA